MLENRGSLQLRFTVPGGTPFTRLPNSSRPKDIQQGFLSSPCFNPSLLAERIYPQRALKDISPLHLHIRLNPMKPRLSGDGGAIRSRYGSRFADRRHFGLASYRSVLASMIEKEAVLSSEMPVISSVFHNRLRIKMPLQSDPLPFTAFAPLRQITKRDILRDTVYTYRIKGLPGPIGTPALPPLSRSASARTLFYFVAQDGRNHYFSETLEEHNLAIKNT